MRFPVFIFTLSCLGAFLLVSSPAQAGFWEFLFPGFKKPEYNPYETLTAPFANNETFEKEREKEHLDDLSVPHRTAREISEWLGMYASDLLTFKANGYQAHIREMEPSFSNDGLAAYMEFLRGESILKVLENGQHDITTIKQGEPLLLNDGEIGGRYRWLYEIPVMISYIQSNTTDYKGVTPVNRRYTITLQVGRVQDAPNEHNLLIETFTGKANNEKQ